MVDPSLKSPALDVFTTNYDALKVQLYQVGPADLPAFTHYLRNMWNRKKPPKLPGKRVFDKLVRTSGKGGRARRDARRAGARARRTARTRPRDRDHRAVPVARKLRPAAARDVDMQVTKLAVDAYVDDTELVAFATDLGTGKPARDVALEIRPWGIAGKSDDRGMATIALSDKALKGNGFLMARRGDDVAFVTDDAGWWGDSPTWIKRKQRDHLAWYVVDDRQMYKPGEEVHLKGFLRAMQPGEGGDIGGVAGMVLDGELRGEGRAGQRDRQGQGERERGRRVEREVHAAEDAEPRPRADRAQGDRPPRRHALARDRISRSSAAPSSR